MKNRLTRTLAGFFALLALSLASCEKDEVKATLTPNSTPTLTASTNSVVLAQANSAQTAVTYTWTPVSGFTWNNADNPYNPTVKYAIQIDKQGNNFGAPASIDAGNGPTTAVTVEQLNSSLINLGIAPGVSTPLEVRLWANYAGNSPTASAAVPLTATAYKVCVPPNSDVWSIIGPAGVDWDTDVPLTYDCDQKVYTLTRAMNAGAFKFRKNKAWTVNYGSSSNTGGALVAGGSDIAVTTAGTYTIKLDLNKLVYSITKN